MMKRISKNNIICYFFYFLWPLMIMPKEIQFVALSFYVLILLCSFGFRLHRTGLFFLIGLMVQTLAVLNQTIVIGTDQMTRVFAAFNTILIWFISIIAFCIIINKKNSFEQYQKIGKIMFINMAVLFGIYLLSKVASFDLINFGNYALVLRRPDYISTGVTKRFCAFMETVLGPSHFYICALPLSLLYVKKWKNNFLKLGYCILSFLPIYATHSRVGVFTCALVLLICIYYLLRKDKNAVFKNDKPFFDFVISFAIILAFLFIIFSRDIIISKFDEVWNLRSGSNDARFEIYRESLSVTWVESPFIGIGIKYMLGDFPYGSHCTYIGLFYKSGILGSVFYFLGFVDLIRNMVDTRKKSNFQKMLVVSFLTYFLLLTFADIDACDWIIMMWFVSWGLLLGQQQYKGENKCPKFKLPMYAKI